MFLFKTGIAAIIIDDTHNLVVAGAGSGKTEVLITRVAYLKERESDGIIAKRILILAFQNKAAREISERLNKRFDIGDIEAITFHSLGMKILKDGCKGSGKESPQFKFLDSDFEKEFSPILILFSTTKKWTEISKRKLQII